MKKLVIILFIILLFSLSFLSATLVEKTLTAIKYGSTSGTEFPDPNTSIRILNSSSVQLSLTGDGLEIPIYARENSYKSFTWSFSGNKYNDSLIAFRAYPMQTETLGGTIVYLPYTIKFQCENTKVGNTITSYKGSSYVGTTEFEAGGTVYEFQYADRIKINNVEKSSFASSYETVSFLIGDTTTKETSFNYNMNEGSTVSGGTGPYTAGVCNQWNRNGYAMVSVDVSEENIDDFTSGRYSAQIVVEIEGT